MNACPLQITWAQRSRFKPRIGRGPGLQPAVIGFNWVVGVLLHHVPRLGHDLVEHPRVRRGPVGGHLGGPPGCVQRPGKEPSGRRQIPLRRGENIDDLPVLVDRPVQVHPLPSDLEIGLVHEPAIPRDVPARRAASINSGVNRCTHR
jgi:hypothetical protein